MEISQLINLRQEKTDDGRTLVLVDVSGAGRLILGEVVTDRVVHYREGGADRVANPVKPLS